MEWPTLQICFAHRPSTVYKWDWRVKSEKINAPENMTQASRYDKLFAGDWAPALPFGVKRGIIICGTAQ